MIDTAEVKPHDPDRIGKPNDPDDAKCDPDDTRHKASMIECIMIRADHAEWRDFPHRHRARVIKCATLDTRDAQQMMMILLHLIINLDYPKPHHFKPPGTLIHPDDDNYAKIQKLLSIILALKNVQ